jgi:hypothetical protein
MQMVVRKWHVFPGRSSVLSICTDVGIDLVIRGEQEPLRGYFNGHEVQ